MTKKLKGRPWLRGRTSVFLSEGCGFDSSGLHVKVSLGKIHNPCLPPKKAPDYELLFLINVNCI